MLIQIEAGGPHGLRGVLLKQRSITRRTLNPCMQPGFTLVQGLQEGIGIAHWESSILNFFGKIYELARMLEDRIEWLDASFWIRGTGFLDFFAAGKCHLSNE
jgi:hypothetical protein